MQMNIYSASPIVFVLCTCFTQSYLESLHELHEDWLIRRTNSSFVLPAPVLVSRLKTTRYVAELCVHMFQSSECCFYEF